MEHPALPAQTGHAGSRAVSLGNGWLMPAALIAFLLAAVYLPAHRDSAPGVSGLIALIAALYAAGMVIAAPRLARGAVLRIAGQPFRVVLLGGGEDEIGDPGVPGRLRLLAIAVGASVSLVLFVAGLQLASRAAVGSYPHAVATVAANVALISALGTLVPSPPFVGWSLALTVLDMAGTPRATRIRTAARLGRFVATPFIIGAAALATRLDPWMAIPLGLLGIAHVWHSTDVEVGGDTLARFLDAHTVGDLARPPMLRVGPDDLVTRDTLGGRGDRGAVFVEERHFVVGAIGTHRLRSAGAGHGRRAETPWRATMVPVARLSWLHGSEPATRVPDALRPSGVVLVIIESEIWAIEEDDLFDQAAAWARGRRRAPSAEVRR